MVCGDGGLKDLFDWNVVGCGGGAAILEFWSCVEFFGGERAHLNADISVGSGDRLVAAIEAGALFLMDADAKGAGLAKE